MSIYLILQQLITRKGCKIFEVLKGNNLNGISSEIKDLISHPISSTTQGTNTIENLLELITKDLSEIAANPINNTITSSTAEISEAIFSDNTES